MSENIVAAPQIVRRIEDNLKYLIVSTWARRERDQWWRRVVKTRTSSTKRELLQWMLETAGIKPMGDGGNSTYEDIEEIYHEIIAERFGASLRLSDDEIEDGSAFDRAGKWATQISSSGAMFPQEQAAQLLRDGKTKGSYDGVSFFNVAHPVSGIVGDAGPSFSNLHYDMPFTPENVAEGFKRIATIKAPDGKYRKLKPRVIGAGEIERLAVTQALSAESFADPVRSGTTAAATNVIKTSYGFDEPIITADFDDTGDAYYNTATGAYQGADDTGATLKTRGVWYMFCELLEDDELGGLIHSERKAFSLNSFAMLADVVLAQMDAWEWQFKGRSADTYGHPFLLHRFEPNPAP